MFRQCVVKFIHYQDVFVREMCLIQSITGYRLPFYGKINKLSFFKAHQITNIGALIYDDAKCLNFYDNVLGLLQGHDGKPGNNTYEEPLSRAVIGLNKGESYMYTHSDDPQKMRSGKLKVIRFPREVKLETKMSETDPGSLGYSLYILRVTAIEVYHGKVKGSTATDVTDICKNEFGERSFPFRAPDGYFWTILEHVG